MSHPPLPDQTARDRFLTEMEQNFSVIAPAGVGKTTAIVGRIARLGMEDIYRSEHLLPRLVVVTYTNKAAQELQERARRELLEQAKGNELVLRLFGQAFFGTIHSFCLELLRRYGHHLGLPPTLDVPDDEDALWLRFIRSQDRLTDLVPEPLRADFLRLAPLGKVLELAKGLPATAIPHSPEALPMVNVAPLLNWEATGRSAATIARSQAALQAWVNAQDDPTARGLGTPESACTAKEFLAAWTETFNPVEDWLADACLHFAAAVAERYRVFRLEAGQLTYADQIQLADELLGLPVAREEICSRQHRVILDEAQDTDPAQFRVLTAVTRESADAKAWPGAGEAPAGGRFCMVGDPQQSIYSDRADLPTYLALHAALTAEPQGAALTFSVTMRCDQQIVDSVNAVFPSVLDGNAGQVDLVPLVAKPGASVGNVERFNLSIDPDGTSKADVQRAEAFALADWLVACQPQDFGVSRWGEIALLCPRKDGLEKLAFAFANRGLPVQNHSRNDILGDDPAFAWLSGLLWVLAQPGDSFELFGVLREVFALNDGDMANCVQAAHAEDQPHPLRLEEKPTLDGELGEVLGALYQLRQNCVRLPLREVVERVISETALTSRLAALPTLGLGQAQASLDRLRLEASSAEARGDSLVAFAAALRQRYQQPPSDAAPDPDSIQLLSCHKSKGLEWPVVILPFLFTAVKSPNPNFPQRYGAVGEVPVLAMSKTHPRDEAKSAAARSERQTLERLLYVTATRARHSLILVDDGAYFQKKDGSPQGGSFAEMLDLVPSGCNQKWWAALPSFSAKSELYPVRNQPQDAGETCPAEPALPAPDLVRALAVASDFPQRLLPSGLAKHAAFEGHHRDESDLASEPLFPEIRAAAAAKRGADYGNWWHLTMETIPWGEDVAAWRAHTQQRLAHCPDPPRGEHELEQFYTSEAAILLGQAGLVVRTELPIFWPESEGAVYDGTIDMAVRQADGTWLVLDWKTDIISDQGLPGLLATYGAQLDCYRRALSTIFETEARACLYSTRRGELVFL